MTVKELICLLQTLPQDKIVVNGDTSQEIEVVEEAKGYYVKDEPENVVLID